MTLMNFDSPLDTLGVQRVVTKAEVEATPIKRVVKGNQERNDWNVPVDQWGWRELRDYVVTQIEMRTGTWDRVPYKENSIFQRFIKVWGSQAGQIARFVFEVMDGKWDGKNVTLTHFCAKADPFFAGPIAEKLTIAASLPKK